MDRPLLRNDERYRRFTFLLYPDSTTYDCSSVLAKLTEEYMKKQKAYAFWILHNKDVNDDGTLKKPHYHVCVVFENKHYCGAFKRFLGLDELIAMFEVDDVPKLARYFLHGCTPEDLTDET